MRDVREVQGHDASEESQFGSFWYVIREVKFWLKGRCGEWWVSLDGMGVCWKVPYQSSVSVGSGEQRGALWTA